jgi:hypothetical protein
VASRKSKENGVSNPASLYSAACVERWFGLEGGARTHLSRSLTTEFGLWSSFLSGLFLGAVCNIPASIGDSESRDVNAVGGNGFLRTGEEVCGYAGKEIVLKVADGVGL